MSPQEITVRFSSESGRALRWLREIRTYGENAYHELRAQSVPALSQPVNVVIRPDERSLALPEPQLQDLCDLVRLESYRDRVPPVLAELVRAIWEPPVDSQVPDEQPLAQHVPDRPEIRILPDRIVTPRYTFDVEDARYFNPRTLAEVLWNMPWGIGAEYLSKMLIAEEQARNQWPTATLRSFSQFRTPKLHTKVAGYTLEMYAWLYGGAVIYQE